jgi:hypothetical protein
MFSYSWFPHVDHVFWQVSLPIVVRYFYSETLPCLFWTCAGRTEKLANIVSYVVLIRDLTLTHVLATTSHENTRLFQSLRS